jgi:hypothetical protein
MTPIAPAPLRLVVEDAETILVGKVLSVTPLQGSPPHSWNSHAAKIAVTEWWKGKTPDVISVVHPKGLMCPMPPEFPEGSQVLAFLNRFRGSPDWETVSLSYGARALPDAEARDACHARVLEMIRILEISDPAKKRAAIVEWLVACAESPHTRWDAAYDLSWGKDREFEPMDERLEDFSTFLSEDHRRRLVRVVAGSQDLFNSGSGHLLRLVVQSKDPSLIPVLKRNLETVLADPSESHGVPIILRALADILDSDELRKLAGGSWSPSLLESLRTDKVAKVRKAVSKRLP